MNMKPNIFQALNLLAEHQGRSNRSISIESKTTRTTVARQRRALEVALARVPGGSKTAAVAKVVQDHQTWKARERPDFQAVDEALDRGETLRTAYRRYRTEKGKRALTFGQFAHVCRVKRGGTSLKCVRRSHTRAPSVELTPRILSMPCDVPPATSRLSTSKTEGRA